MASRQPSRPTFSPAVSPKQTPAPRRSQQNQPLDIFLGHPEHDEILAEELCRAYQLKIPKAYPTSMQSAQQNIHTSPVLLASGVVALSSKIKAHDKSHDKMHGAVYDAIFARQVLPNAVFLQANDVRELAAQILQQMPLDIMHAMARDEEDTLLDVILPAVVRKGSAARQEHPLSPQADALREMLAGKLSGRKEAALAALAISQDQSALRPVSSSITLIQILLVDAWQAYMSIASTDKDPLRAWPASFAGGQASVELDKRAPSTAHAKLDEALSWLQDGPNAGETALDLGAAPGGWTWRARMRGAKAIAVDRGELDSRLTKDPLVQHLRSDAFGYIPNEPIDWLLCDVIDMPQKNAERLVNFMRGFGATPPVRGAVVTLKLKNPLDWDALAKGRAICRGEVVEGFVGRCKNLFFNKLEVTCMVRRDTSKDASKNL